MSDLLDETTTRYLDDLLDQMFEERLLRGRRDTRARKEFARWLSEHSTMNCCQNCKWWRPDLSLVPSEIHPQWTQDTIDRINKSRTENGLCTTPSDKITTDCGEQTIRTHYSFGCTEWEKPDTEDNSIAGTL